jgi:hypothetical protein
MFDVRRREFITLLGGQARTPAKFCAPGVTVAATPTRPTLNDATLLGGQKRGNAMMRTLYEGLLLKAVSPSLYQVVDAPLVIQRLPFGGWRVIYYDHTSGEWVLCYSEPRASLELAVQDAFFALATARSAAMKLSALMKPPILPHPAPEVIGLPVGAWSLREPMERPATLLPVSEAEMLDCLIVHKDALLHKMDRLNEVLAEVARQGLRDFRQPLTDLAVGAANAGEKFADALLRDRYAEMATVPVGDGLLTPEQEIARVKILNYGNDVVRGLRDTRKRRGPR